MQRREFLQQTCSASLCGCVLAALFAPVAASASDEAKPAPKPAPPEPAADQRLAFAQRRYAALLTALSQHVEPGVLQAALADVGDGCAGEFKALATYAGKLDAFLALVRDKWHGQAEYDSATGIVTLAFPAVSACPCALVKKGLTPAAVCECSLGWQRRAFSIVTGHPVDVKLKGSLLRGDDRCSFAIHVA